MDDIAFFEALLKSNDEVISDMMKVRLKSLPYVVEHRHREAIRLLLEHGVDPNACDPDDPDLPIILYVLRGGEFDEGTEDIIQMLLEHGANVNAKDWRENTLLHQDRRLPLDIVRLALKHGADVSLRNEDEETPLHFVRAAEVVDLYVEHGADVNAKDMRGRTPLHAAQTYEAVRALLEHGADVNARDYLNKTPLHNKSPYYSSDISAVLIEFGADVNARDRNRSTPLHYLSMSILRSRGIKNIEDLLQAGAEVNARDENGKTPLHYTRSDEVVALLLKYGADPLIKDGEEKYPHEVNACEAKTAAYEKALMRQATNETVSKRETPLAKSKKRGTIM